MKPNKLLCFFAILCALHLFHIDVSYAVTVHQRDTSNRHEVTYVHFADGRMVSIPEGKSLTVSEPVTVNYRSEMGWLTVPTTPKPVITITFNDDVVKSEFALVTLIATPKRRVILNYPPVSSVWHLPAGISMLAAYLQERGHQVTQHYGHIAGLKYVLREHGGETIDKALATIRDSKSDIKALYDARMTFERVSSGIITQDKFVVERNNVTYVSHYYDGSIEKMLDAIRNRKEHLWYSYFAHAEVPFAKNVRPHLYGISIADERQFVQGCILAAMIKETLPNTLVVMGGNFWARPLGAYLLPQCAEMFDYCDAIVWGEGFRALEVLTETLTPSSAPGTVWRSGDNRVIVNPVSLPIPFETLPTPVFDGSVRQWSPDFVPSLYPASNCLTKDRCDFCAIEAGSATFHGKPREMSPRRMAEHILAIGASRFEIVSAMFPVSRQIALGKRLKERGLSATWDCYMTADNTLVKQDVCDALAEAGCGDVMVGFESLAPETLAQAEKTWNKPENYGIILSNLRKAGIQTHVFLLIGLPGEPLHWGLKWIAFLEKYGRDILTIKAGRYRVTRLSRDETEGKNGQWIEVLPDTKPLHLNRDFRYRVVSNKKVDAMRTVLEEACRRHWAYGVTSTIPWWVNRGRYSWEELEQMAKVLPPEKEVPHLERALAKVASIVKEELGQKVSFNSFEDLLAFSRTL